MNKKKGEERRRTQTTNKKREEEEGEKEETSFSSYNNKQTHSLSVVNWSVAHLPTSYKNQPHQIGVVGYKLRSPEYCEPS